MRRDQRRQRPQLPLEPLLIPPPAIHLPTHRIHRVLHPRPIPRRGLRARNTRRHRRTNLALHPKLRFHLLQRDHLATRHHRQTTLRQPIIRRTPRKRRRPHHMLRIRLLHHDDHRAHLVHNTRPRPPEAVLVHHRQQYYRQPPSASRPAANTSERVSAASFRNVAATVNGRIQPYAPATCRPSRQRTSMLNEQRGTPSPPATATVSSRAYGSVSILTASSSRHAPIRAAQVRRYCCHHNAPSSPGSVISTKQASSTAHGSATHPACHSPRPCCLLGVVVSCHNMWGRGIFAAPYLA